MLIVSDSMLIDIDENTLIRRCKNEKLFQVPLDRLDYNIITSSLSSDSNQLRSYSSLAQKNDIPHESVVDVLKRTKFLIDFILVELLKCSLLLFRSPIL